MALGWKLHGDGRHLPPGEVVRPDERLSWPRTAGLGLQHVIAMFGATFVFPIVMGLDPNLAILMSGVATIVFLAIVRGKVPSYLGTSASFAGAVVAIRQAGGVDSVVTGAILVAGLVLVAVGFAVHVAGGQVVTKVLPPAVTGAVVMLIGFNLAPVVAKTYWPQDQWVALLTMVAVIMMSCLLPGFWSRVSILLALVFGVGLSVLLDRLAGPLSSVLPGQNLRDAAGVPCGVEGPFCVAQPFLHDRVDMSAVADARWFGLPDLFAPTFQTSAILLALPVVIALIAENAGHVKAVGTLTMNRPRIEEELARPRRKRSEPLDPSLGRAFMGDGVGTVLASAVGGSPTTTYAENIGVMAASRVYSTAAYYVAALIAILVGLCPKFGAVVAATPGGVLGGITVVLYGMIGLLGAKIWIENKVDMSSPANLVPLAAGIILAIGDTTLQVNSEFRLAGIAFGTIVTVALYHVIRSLTPPELRPANGAAADIVDLTDVTMPIPVVRADDWPTPVRDRSGEPRRTGAKHR